MKATRSLFGKKIESPDDLFQAMDRDGDGILAYDEVRGGTSLVFVFESLATYERITDARFLFLFLFSFFFFLSSFFLSFFFFLSSSLVHPTHCQHSIDLALT